MRPRQLISIIVLVFCAVCCVSAHAQTTGDRYLETFGDLDQFMPEDMDLQADILLASLRPSDCLNSSFDRSWKKRRELGKILETRDCEWDVDLSDYLNADLSHLSLLRSCARLLANHARKAMAFKDADRTVECIGDTYRLVNHVGPDTIISALIRMAIMDLGNELLEEAESRGLISQKGAEDLLQSIRSLDIEDPVRFHEALLSEQTMTRIMLKDTIDQFSGAHRESIEDGLDRYWNTMLMLWRERDAEDITNRLRELEDDIENGEFGVFVKLVGISIDKAVTRVLESNKVLASGISSLESIASGRSGRFIPKNAAVVYANAIDLVEGQEDWRNDGSITDQIRELLHEAVSIEYCRFPNPEDVSMEMEQRLVLWTAPVVSWWLPGLDSLIGWYLEQSERSASNGRISESLADLEIATGVVSHLCDDTNIASSIVAARWTGEIIDLVTALLETGVPSENLPALLSSLRTIPTGDPFGIGQATEQTKLRLTIHLDQLVEQDVVSGQSIPSRPAELLYATAWLARLPAPSNEAHGLMTECTWPDGASAAACTPLVQSSIELAAQDGVQAREAWELDVPIAMESTVDICELDIDALIDGTRSRLLETRRALRNQIQSASTE